MFDVQSVRCSSINSYQPPTSVLIVLTGIIAFQLAIIFIDLAAPSQNQ